jgi:CRP/FNR family transcriptional regulator, cyclic AMP receptor protein
VHTIEDYLGEHPVFAGLDADALRLVAGCGKNVSLAAGDFLLRQGEPADMFYLVRRGRVAVEVHGPGSGPIVVDTADRGEVVGWSWLVRPYRWQFDARVVEATGVVAFDAHCLREKCEQDPRLGYELLQRVVTAMFGRLVDARVRLLDLYGPPEARDAVPR